MAPHILLTGLQALLEAPSTMGLETGYKVTAISRTPLAKENHHELDLLDGDAVQRFVKEIDVVNYVVHCAAIAHGENPPHKLSVADFNSQILINLIDSFSDEQPHWLFLSSMSVYGHAYVENPIKMSSARALRQLWIWKLLRAVAHFCLGQTDISRLPPTYNEAHLVIQERVYFPKTRIKVHLTVSQYLLFGSCYRSSAQCTENSQGLRLHQIETNPVSQHKLASTSPGFVVPFPQMFQHID